MTVSDMVKSIAVSSANDCACAMAEHLAGSEGAFVDMMNARAKELGMEDTINSPTFAIVNEYTDAQGEAVYHFDFYRIKKLAELYDLGFDNYLDSGCFCLMEWPELVEELLPEETLRITLIEQPDGSRMLSFDL